MGLMGTERFWIQIEMDVHKCLLGPFCVGLGLLEGRDSSSCASLRAWPAWHRADTDLHLLT